jgi:cytochrome c nitrite reductase small subunit
MIRFLSYLKPPEPWRVPVIIILGIFFGIASFAFYISKAPSYLSDNPKTCMNCHIMSPEYSTWAHSSHREHTTCNDCHVPHNNVFNKYYFKAKDGLRHATIFTLRGEPQVIRIKEAGANAVQKNCIRCHGALLTDVKINQLTDSLRVYRGGRKCWDCHRLTPHDRVRGLNSTPFARVPLLESPVPLWLQSLMKKETK